MSCERDQYSQSCLLVERCRHLIRKRSKGFGQVGWKDFIVNG